MKKLVYSPDFREKMIKLRHDLEMRFGPETRKRVFNEINHRIHLLREQNYLGISIREMYGIDCDCYYIYVAHNYVFYEVDEKYIRIISIYHEREEHIVKFLGNAARFHESPHT